MPIKTTPFVWACFHCVCKSGASAIQGAQVDDQKLITIGLPLKSTRESCPLLCELNSDSVKFGAACPINGSLFWPTSCAGVNSCVQRKMSSPTLMALTILKIMMLRLRLVVVGAGGGPEFTSPVAVSTCCTFIALKY